MKKTILIITSILAIIIMTIWMWPNLQENSRQSWIDKWDEQMK